jgi:hypothetical protein
VKGMWKQFADAYVTSVATLPTAATVSIANTKEYGEFGDLVDHRNGAFDGQ